MITTTFMGLTVWDRTKDDFDHSQLANNFVKIDEHNHGGIISEPEWNGPVGPQAELLKGKWVPAGRGLPVINAENPVEGGLQPESIWRFLIAQRAIGHRQIGLEQVVVENIGKEAVTNPKIGKEAVTDPKVERKSLTITAFHPSVLPLGSVIDWWRPPGSANTPTIADPEGKQVWQICDGSKLISGNRLGPAETESTANIPDLRSKFIRGTELSKIEEGGGSSAANFAHTHNVAPHSHTVNAHQHPAGSHRHGIATAGFHHHTMAGGYPFHTRSNAFIMGLTFKDAGGNTRHNSLESLYIPAPQFDHDNEPGVEEDVVATMDEAGSHTHGGGQTGEGEGETGAASPGTSGTGLTTESALGNINTEPPWIGLVKIMRIR